MIMHNPPHPGRHIKNLFIEDEDGKKIGSVNKASEILGFHRITIEEIIKGTRGVSTGMAVALENNGYGSAKMWLGMQADYDLWQARNKQ